MRRRGVYVWALLALTGCSQEIHTGGDGGSGGRPSVIAACSQGLKSEPQPQPVHRPTPTSPSIVVNVPPPEPTVRCDRTDARTGTTALTRRDQ